MRVLRTATPNADWRSFKFTCEETDGLLGDVSSWQAGEPWLHLIEDSVVVLCEDVDFGDEGVAFYHAEKIDVAKDTDSLDVALPGMTAWWDPATRLVKVEPETGFLRIGIFTEPAAAADTIAEIDLDGAAAADKAFGA